MEPFRSSEDLLRQWQEAGDLDALDELLRTEVTVLKDLIASRGRDMVSGSASASDIAQEAVLRLLQAQTVPHFTDPRALRSYLWVTAWRLLLQRIRRPYRRKKALDLGASSQLPAELIESAGVDAEEAEAASALDFAMNLLSEQDREIIHGIYFEGQKVKSVASTLQLSESAVKMRLMRARRTLAARLSAWKDVIG